MRLNSSLSIFTLGFIALTITTPLIADGGNKPSKDFEEIVACMKGLLDSDRKPIEVVSARVQCPQTTLDGFPIPTPSYHRRDGVVEIIAPPGYLLDHRSITKELVHHDHCHDDGLELSGEKRAIGRFHCVSRASVNTGGTDCGMKMNASAVRDLNQLTKAEKDNLFKKCL